MNEQLQARLKGMQEVLMAHHRASALLPNAAKGDEREVLVREFLEKVFPAPYRFGCGVVTDTSGETSGQIDVIVEWPFFASFPAFLGTSRLYLAESVAFAIAVKSDLSAQWGQVEETVRQLRPLHREWQRHAAMARDTPTGVPNFREFGPSLSRIPYVAVGFTGFKTAEKLLDKLNATPPDRRPDAALVIESGSYAGFFLVQKAFGEAGLFALCVDGSHFLRNVLIAEPELIKYVG